MTFAEWKALIRETATVLIAVSLIGTSIYMSVVGMMPAEIMAGLSGMAAGFFLAERKNGAERTHEERMEIARQSRRG